MADAVGATKAALLSCLTQLQTLELHVQVEQLQLQLDAGRCYLFSVVEEGYQLYQCAPCHLKQGEDIGEPTVSAAAMQEFCQQVATQTEQLLWLAYRLQLAPIIDRLHGIIRLTTPLPGGVLDGLADTVFSAHVLDAKLGSNKLGKDAWIAHILQNVHGLKPGSFNALFKPVDLSDEAIEPVVFKAILQREFFGAPAGTLLDVKFELLTSGRVSIGEFDFEAALQLL
jgi:hypothetical protein